MQNIELLNYLEKSQCKNYLIDLHIVNNQIIGFYKTFYIKYMLEDKEMSYYFPLTFNIVDNKLIITAIFGSVSRNYILPKLDYDLPLELFQVNNHLYKLLGMKLVVNDWKNFINFKPFMSAIEQLDRLKFSFMRIN